MRSAAVLGLAATALAAPSLIEERATCAASYDGSFGITVFKVTNGKREVQPRDGGALVITLQDGVLHDDKGRIGNVVANYQFQFDPAPGQPDAVETADFSVCSNGALAHKGDVQWYQCLSGNFYNLYSKNWAAQCEPVQIFIQPIAGTGSGSVTQIGDGQAQQPTKVSQIGDGQVQAPTNVPATQIGDGQVQAPTGAPVSQIGDGQVQVPSSIAVVTQIGDGQVQAPTGAPATQIGDGQVQAPTGAPATQIGDGQVQAPTGAPVTQIGDGQVQAPTGAPVTQIGDGQVQVPTGAPTPTPSYLPPSAGNQVIPGAFAAFVAVLGAVFAL